MIHRALSGICKDLRMLGEHELANKALIAYAAATDTETPRVDLSYSYVMRQLRKGDDDRRKKFQVAFKEAFDRALLDDIEEPAAIALMVAMKVIDLQGDELEVEDESDAQDAVTKSREENQFASSTPGIGDATIPNQMRIGVPPHADPEFSPLSRIAATRLFCKCNSHDVLKPRVFWFESRDEAIAEADGGKLHSAVLPGTAKVERIDKPVTDRLLSSLSSDDMDAVALRGGRFMVFDPGALIDIKEEDEESNTVMPEGWVPGERDNSTRNVGLQYAYPGSGSGIGGGMPDGAAGTVQLPFGGDQT
jgi:hypothetical protein